MRTFIFEVLDIWRHRPERPRRLHDAANLLCLYLDNKATWTYCTVITCYFIIVLHLFLLLLRCLRHCSPALYRSAWQSDSFLFFSSFSSLSFCRRFALLSSTFVHHSAVVSHVLLFDTDCIWLCLIVWNTQLDSRPRIVSFIPGNRAQRRVGTLCARWVYMRASWSSTSN